MCVQAIHDAVACHVELLQKRSEKKENLENLILSRLYHYKVNQHEVYNWHMFVSEVHTPREKHLNSITTNHKSILQALAAINENDGSGEETPIIPLPDALENVALNFYGKYEATFSHPASNSQRRLEVVIFNQWADRSTTT